MTGKSHSLKKKCKKKIHGYLRGSLGTSNQVKLNISVADVWSCLPKTLQIADPVICMQGWTACLVTAWLAQATIGQADLPLDLPYCQHCTSCAFSPDLVVHRPAATGTYTVELIPAVKGIGAVRLTAGLQSWRTERLHSCCNSTGLVDIRSPAFINLNKEQSQTLWRT